MARVRSLLLDIARDEGFELVRIAPAAPQPQVREAALRALEEGRLEGMEWITAAWLTRAADPGAFLAGAQSLLLVALPYRGVDEARPPGADGPSRGRIARYARGRDYHRVFEKKLRRMARRIREELAAGARATVDYGPLLERPLAAAAGLGWQGKSTMLLVPGLGPWVLLGVVATTLDAEPDQPLAKSCGSCTRCAAACPTGALGADGGALDARLCISYHTIENRGPIPLELRPKFGDWIFGCDDCLDSCPVGNRATATHPDFVPKSIEDAHPALAPLLLLDYEAFAARFRGRAIMRAKRDGFLRNVCVALGNVGTADDLSAILRALDDPSPLVRGHAAWAAAAIGVRVGTQKAVGGALEARLAGESDGWVREELEQALQRSR
jgi:epoxyqueuosine reductase